MNAPRSMSNVKVSVLMITYNHVRFVAQAIESVLAQKTSFAYELVIGEDCSVDGTRDVVRTYQDRYPDVIRALLRDRNLGMMDNLIQTHCECRGQYVALLEGDDFWTTPDKLQVQADYLDEHPACAICFHANSIQYEDGRPPRTYLPPGRRAEYSIEDLLVSDLMYTCSVMYRRGLFGEFPAWFRDLPMGDWPLHLLNAQHGQIGYIDRVMSTYRVHPGGLWSRLGRVERLHWEIRAYELFARHLEPKYRPAIRSMIGRRYYRLAVEHASRGEVVQAIACVRKSLTACPLNREIRASKWGGLLLIPLKKVLLSHGSPINRPGSG